jgi:hypothetical protein
MRPQLVYWNVKTGFTAYKVCGLWVRGQDSFDSMIICIRQNGQRLFVLLEDNQQLRRIRARDKHNRAKRSTRAFILDDVGVKRVM